MIDRAAGVGRGARVKHSSMPRCSYVNCVMSIIFLDRNKLSPGYVPEVLPHRSAQMQTLRSVFIDSIRPGKESLPKAVQVIGGVGSGKTCTVTRFGEELQSEARKNGLQLRHVYVNCKLEGAKRILLYRNMLEKLSPGFPSRSLSSEEMLHQLTRLLAERRMYLLVTVDEIDYFCKKSDEPIVYDLTRLNEIYPGEPCRVIGTIFISRDTSFHSHLDPSEVSSLGRTYVEFERYDSSKVKDILDLRVAEAFHRGVIEEESVEYVSDVVSREPISGDIRVALDILLYAGIRAETEGCNTVRPEHFRFVLRQTHPYITSEDILRISENGRLVLLATIRALLANRSAYVDLGDVRDFYHIVCEEHQVQPVQNMENEMQDLIDRGLVTMKSLTQFGIVGATATDLDQFLSGLGQRIRDDIKT